MASDRDAASSLSPSSASAQPTSFKTNVARKKTKRWVTAKSYSYDGDDWGGSDDDDELDEQPSSHSSHTPPVPSAPPRFYASHPHTAAAMDHSRRSSSSPSRNSPATSPVLGPPRMGPPPNTGQIPRHPHPLHVETYSAYPPSTNNPVGHHGGPIPHSVRASSTERSSSPLARSDSPGAYPQSPTTAGRDTSDSAKPLPFIRPADIYKRMAEEQEKARQKELQGERPSQGSERPVPIHPVNVIAPEKANGQHEAETATSSVPSQKEGAKSYPLQEQSTTAPIPVGDAGPVDVSSKDQPPWSQETNVPLGETGTDEAPSLGGHKQLPEIHRFSGFGEGFMASDAHEKTYHTAQAERKPVPNAHETGLHHNPSHGFRSVVHQAFDVETPSTTDGSIGRSNSDGTSVTSPILHPVTTSAVHDYRGSNVDQTPTIIEEPIESNDLAVPNNPATPPPGFKPGHRRSLTPPSSGTSPARQPVVSTNVAVAKSEAADLSEPTGAPTQDQTTLEDNRYSASSPEPHRPLPQSLTSADKAPEERAASPVSVASEKAEVVVETAPDGPVAIPPPVPAASVQEAPSHPPPPPPPKDDDDDAQQAPIPEPVRKDTPPALNVNVDERQPRGTVVVTGPESAESSTPDTYGHTINDRLRDEIMESLSQRSSMVIQDPNVLSTEPDAQQEPRSRIRYESNLIPSEYDSYWNEQGDESDEESHETAALTAAPVASAANLPTIAGSADIHSADAQRVPQHELKKRFSWEDNSDNSDDDDDDDDGTPEKSATAQSPDQPPILHPAQPPLHDSRRQSVEANTPITVPDSAELTRDYSPEAPLKLDRESKKESETTPPTNNHDERASRPNSGLIVVPPVPAFNDTPLDPQGGIDDSPRASPFVLPPVRTSTDSPKEAQANPHAGPNDQPTTIPQPTSPDVKIAGFREIMAVKTPHEKIRKFDETREQFADMDTGLSDWIKHAAEEYPEHRDLVERNGQLPPGASSSHRPSPSRAKFPRLTSLSGISSAHRESSTTGHARHSSGSPLVGMINSQHMQAKGKDLLHNAGVLGGKAGGAARGLFAKGRSKFRNSSGGDKVHTRPTSSASTLPGSAVSVSETDQRPPPTGSSERQSQQQTDLPRMLSLKFDQAPLSGTLAKKSIASSLQEPAPEAAFIDAEQHPGTPDDKAPAQPVPDPQPVSVRVSTSSDRPRDIDYPYPGVTAMTHDSKWQSPEQARVGSPVSAIEGRLTPAKTDEESSVVETRVSSMFMGSDASISVGGPVEVAQAVPVRGGHASIIFSSPNVSGSSEPERNKAGTPAPSQPKEPQNESTDVSPPMSNTGSNSQLWASAEVTHVSTPPVETQAPDEKNPHVDNQVSQNKAPSIRHSIAGSFQNIGTNSQGVASNSLQQPVHLHRRFSFEDDYSQQAISKPLPEIPKTPHGQPLPPTRHTEQTPPPVRPDSARPDSQPSHNSPRAAAKTIAAAKRLSGRLFGRGDGIATNSLANPRRSSEQRRDSAPQIPKPIIQQQPTPPSLSVDTRAPSPRPARAMVANVQTSPKQAPPANQYPIQEYYRAVPNNNSRNQASAPTTAAPTSPVHLQSGQRSHTAPWTLGPRTKTHPDQHNQENPTKTRWSNRLELLKADKLNPKPEPSPAVNAPTQDVPPMKLSTLVPASHKRSISTKFFRNSTPAINGDEQKRRSFPKFGSLFNRHSQYEKPIQPIDNVVEEEEEEEEEPQQIFQAPKTPPLTKKTLQEHQASMQQRRPPLHVQSASSRHPNRFYHPTGNAPARPHNRSGDYKGFVERRFSSQDQPSDYGRNYTMRSGAPPLHTYATAAPDIRSHPAIKSQHALYNPQGGMDQGRNGDGEDANKLKLRSRSPIGHPPVPDGKPVATTDKSNPAYNLGTFRDAAPTSPRIGDQETPWNISLPEGQGRVHSNGQQAVVSRRSPSVDLPNFRFPQQSQESHVIPQTIERDTATPPPPPPKIPLDAVAPGAQAQHPARQGHGPHHIPTTPTLHITIPPPQSTSPPIPQPVPQSAPQLSVRRATLSDMTDAQRLRQPHGPVELPVPGDDSSEEIVMSSTSYPGQEWQPSYLGTWD
ncbi:hypothetical protein AJ80_05964 [Polytolypa hystricis UAMH7299]|uniref:SWI-SNF chromatin-remodeling complex protein n=1 Tax=Polytolypa hystricis (strain UAMH7299) TaxID=1447883 RepID=A0A2B7XRI6_POLH7|nr:hypothetical protein AJ80_05964 [Polytolypa hystricis UAMH7299]